MSSLSHSRAYLFNKCRKQYDYKYRKNIKPLPRNMYFDSWERMNRGIAVHAGMEWGFLGKPVYEGVQSHISALEKQELSDEQREILPSISQDSITVASEALKWLPVADWEPVVYNGEPMVEAEIRVPIKGWENYVGYADLVARHKPTGRVMVLDYKTRERFEAAGADQYNKQFAIYQYALGKMGVHCDGSLLVELKPAPARRPSSSRSDDCGGIDTERISSDGRFRTIPTLRSQAFLDSIWADFEREAAVMAYLTDDQVYRNLNAYTCRDCPYQKLCMAELNDEDHEYVLKTQFHAPGSLKVIFE